MSFVRHFPFIAFGFTWQTRSGRGAHILSDLDGRPGPGRLGPGGTRFIGPEHVFVSKDSCMSQSSPPPPKEMGNPVLIHTTHARALRKVTSRSLHTTPRPSYLAGPGRKRSSRLSTTTTSWRSPPTLKASESCQGRTSGGSGSFHVRSHRTGGYSQPCESRMSSCSRCPPTCRAVTCAEGLEGSRWDRPGHSRISSAHAPPYNPSRLASHLPRPHNAT